MKLLTFAASLRKDSYNQKLIQVVNSIISKQSGITLDAALYREFEMPIYDGDGEESTGLPKGAETLVARASQAEAFIISTPEYNGSIPGTLKNALDWASRADTNPFEDKPLLLLSASPGALGGVRGLWHTRVPFEAMGTFVHPEMFGLPKAHQAFTPEGALVDPKTASRLEALISEFLKRLAR